MENSTSSRRDVAQRKAAMVKELRAASRAASAAPDAIMLSVRELSAQYGLALRTVSLELQKLAKEGVLYTVPRVGTFVGRPRSGRQDVFLLVLPVNHKADHYLSVRFGFEGRIARLGATSLTLDAETATEYLQDSTSVSIAGIMQLRNPPEASELATSGTPYMVYGELSGVPIGADAIYFDNADGGWQATRHLLALGHKRIAFFGLHGSQDSAGPFLWSQQREAGWKRALGEAGLSAEGLSFCPQHTPHITAQREAAHAVAQRLVKRSDITAAVVVNAFATRGLFEGLSASGRPLEQWPAMVGFDSDLLQGHASSMHLVTALHQPWEELGSQAANLLWSRTRGQITGPPQQHLVQMSLIPRLSCRQEWHRIPGAFQRIQESALATI